MRRDSSGWSFFKTTSTKNHVGVVAVQSIHFSHLKHQTNIVTSDNYHPVNMGKKRNYRSDSEEELDVEEDQAMNGENDEKMEGAENEEEEESKLPTPSPVKKKDMTLRSGRRKRRRSDATTGLTPPPTTKRAKRKKTTTVDNTAIKNAVDKKPSSVVAFADTNDSPGIVPDPRRISYSRATALKHLPSNSSDEQSEFSSEENESNEIDIGPPKHVVQTNGRASRTDSEDEIAEKSTSENGQNDNRIIDEAIIADGKDVTNDASLASTPESAGTSTLQRLAIFVVLGYLSLLFSMPQVIKLTQNVVPLDDSILPPPPKLSTNASLSEVEKEYVDPLVALESWNKELAQNFEKLEQATMGYISSKESLDVYYDELLDRVSRIAAKLQPQKRAIEARLNNLDRLEELLKGIDINRSNDSVEKDDERDQARRLAQRLLGGTILSTSSIELWDIREDIDTNCDYGLQAEGDDNVGSVENIEEMELSLLASALEEKISNLVLRSTITAEKFIGGAVAEDRIRTWVKSRLAEMVDNDEDAVEVIQEIEDFTQKISKTKPSTNTKESDLQLSQIIVSQLDVHRADTTGIYDYASLKNGAEVIYGGKRGTSKSLIDELPVFNRILQNSNLRFYGFGPETALTATYPPNSLGQCWSFGQTSLKEQLKERQLFENDNRVKNDFKRGNFGTLTIRLSEPISVHGIVIEHPPMRTIGQANSSIRKFRMVGYEDELATSKAWNLGSFEYNIKENRDNNTYLQTFEAATTVFGKEIPPLHSISLAVDSNHGHDYSCLYRFRVHGNKV